MWNPSPQVRMHTQSRQCGHSWRNSHYSDLCKFRTLVWMVDVYSEIIKNNLSNIAVCETLMPPFPKLLRIGLTFDLLTWISIGIIYSSRSIIYLPSLKLLGQSVLEFSVTQGEVDWHDLWPWPTDLNINRDHLLMKDYLPTKFEASQAKCSRVISVTRLRDTDWRTDRQVQSNMSHPSLKEGGGGAKKVWMSRTQKRDWWENHFIYPITQV